MGNVLRVLVVDDHAVVRRGLCSLIIPRNGMEVVGEAADGTEAVEKARSLRPDVIIMDLIMAPMGGLEAIGKIRSEDPGARILVLTSFGEESRVAPAISAGALGYVSKESSPDELFHAIREVASGHLTLPPVAARQLMEDLRQQPRSQLALQNILTERETAVLRAVAEGLSNQEIADRLSISKATVRSHVSSVLAKLGLTSRTQAALYAVETGLAPRQVRRPSQ
jgi:two-component system, NarL family, response regulator LiaR